MKQLSENTYAVDMNGKEFATFPNKAMAEGFCDMQKRKMRGGGISPALPMRAEKESFAAKQQWTVRAL